MIEALEEPGLRIVLIAGEAFDGLRFRRALEECGLFCSLAVFPLEVRIGPDLVAHLSAAASDCDAILADLEDVPLGELPAFVEAVGSLGAPLVGLLPEGSGQLFSAALEAGLDAYLLKGDEPGIVRRLPSVVMWAIDKHRDARARERVIDALRRNERQWVAMMNACLSLITYHDTEGRIVWSNAVETDARGRRVDPLAGTPGDEIWRPEAGGRAECPVPLSVRTGTPHESVVVGADGRRMLQRAFPIAGDDGRTAGAIASTIDTEALSAAGRAIGGGAPVEIPSAEAESAASRWRARVWRSS